ncbi:MAG TPA: hypothetical protein VM755_00190 [Stellaceae bacterium]|nr:hypothetical protein [Stellaceae bacterium]
MPPSGHCAVSPSGARLAAKAQRQYDAADPENRLLVGELERRWNERLIAVRDLECEIDRLNADEVPTPVAKP